VVTDAFWKRLEEHLPGKASDAGATAKDTRLFESGHVALDGRLVIQGYTLKALTRVQVTSAFRARCDLSDSGFP